MDIRQLQYLAALAREKHFTRAAAACNVTQPTLSGRIRQLELELQVPIVERGQRYQGLTGDGERILKWAHVILKNWQSMQEELGHLKDHDAGLSGRLILGGVPSSLPMIPLLTKQIRSVHPGIEFTVLSQSSEEIVRALADFSIDAGITYLDNEPINGLLTYPLYIERYCLFVSDAHPLATQETVTWREVSEEYALSAHAQYAKPAHYRSRLRKCELSSHATVGDKLPHQSVLECSLDGAGEHHAAIHSGSPGKHVRVQGRSVGRAESRAQHRFGRC